MTDAPETAAPDAPPRLIATPAGGVPRLTDTRAGLEACAAALAAGTGPVAVDAERASGIRYGQRAMLVQLKREGAGIWLVDPEALDGLAPLQEALAGVEWILHAASQDLPCLAEQGLRPDRLFDTELAARVSGLPRVGLAAVLEELLGVTLAKEHSAADWSVRPLPEAMLTYAALDVELLVPLREALIARLEADGKLAWAEQEFEHVRTAPPPTPKKDPWRGTSGSQTLRRPVQRAVLKRLWEAREDLARHRDVAPGRLIPDRSIVAAAAALLAASATVAGMIAASAPAQAADQYIALVLPGRMYRAEYEKRGLAPTSLSRALEDGGTLTSVLVPWNTCGAYMAATLGVATLSYLPYCFFNLIMPVMAIALAYLLPPKTQTAG